MPQKKNPLISGIAQHATTAAAVMGVLLLIVLILAYTLVHYKSESKAGFEGLATGPSAFRLTVPACKAAWDPAASAEAEALATVGALQHDSYGEQSLQSAIDLNDDHLAQLMHQGGTP